MPSLTQGSRVSAGVEPPQTLCGEKVLFVLILVRLYPWVRLSNFARSQADADGSSPWQGWSFLADLWRLAHGARAVSFSSRQECSYV
jgi:hypothetical protein